jgi:CBS-domain-containing membrane protein
MNAKDVMTPSVLSIAPDALISDAAGLMLQNKISGLPVIDGSGKLVGVVTKCDFLCRIEIGTQRRRQKNHSAATAPFIVWRLRALLALTSVRSLFWTLFGHQIGS